MFHQSKPRENLMQITLRFNTVCYGKIQFLKKKKRRKEIQLRKLFSDSFTHSLSAKGSSKSRAMFSPSSTLRPGALLATQSVFGTCLVHLYILKECSHCSTVIFAKQEISLTQNKSAYHCKIVFFRCNNWVPERSSNYARHPEKQQQQNQI